MAEAQIHVGLSAEERLATLGLEVSIIHDALDMGQAERAQCSPASAPAFPGQSMHNTVGVALRELLGPKGWTWENSLQMKVRNLSLGVDLVHSTGNEATGLEDAGDAVSTAHPKGGMTAKAIAVNTTQTLFDTADDPDSFVLIQPQHTWMLLYRCEDDLIRSEVSLPGQIIDGRVTEMIERIILPPHRPGGDLVTTDNPTDRPDDGFYFEVRRRSA